MNTLFKGPFSMRAVECKTGINRKVQSTFGSTYAVVDVRGEEVSPELEASKAKQVMDAMNAATK